MIIASLNLVNLVDLLVYSTPKADALQLVKAAAHVQSCFAWAATDYRVLNFFL